MNIDSGTIAKGTVASATWLMNQSFTPEILFFFVSGKVSADTETHMAIGYYHVALDGTIQASAGKSSGTRAKTLSHYAGTTEKIAFTGTSVGVGQFTLNHTVVDANYDIHWIALAS